MPMHRTYPKGMKISGSFLYLALIILIIFFNKTNKVYGATYNWIEVSRTPAGIQYLDKGSIKNKDNKVLELSTKYIKIDTDSTKEIEENIYRMRINCSTHKFKDISVNGKNILSAKWEEPNGDKLINDVISDGCKNV